MNAKSVRYYMNDVELGCTLEVYSRHILGIKENLSEQNLADTDITAKYRETIQSLNTNQYPTVRIQLQDFRAAKLYLMERLKLVAHHN